MCENDKSSNRNVDQTRANKSKTRWGKNDGRNKNKPRDKMKLTNIIQA